MQTVIAREQELSSGNGRIVIEKGAPARQAMARADQGLHQRWQDFEPAESDNSIVVQRETMQYVRKHCKGSTAENPICLEMRPPPATRERPHSSAARGAYAMGMVPIQHVAKVEGQMFRAKNLRDKTIAAVIATSPATGLAGGSRADGTSSSEPPQGGKKSMNESNMAPSEAAGNEKMTSPEEDTSAVSRTTAKEAVSDEFPEMEMERRLRTLAGNKSTNYEGYFAKFIEFTHSPYWRGQLKKKKHSNHAAVDNLGHGSIALPDFKVTTLRCYAAWLLQPEQGRGQSTLLQIRYGINDGYERRGLGRPWKTNANGPDSGGRLFDIEMKSYITNRCREDKNQGITRNTGGASVFEEAGMVWLVERAEYLDAHCNSLELESTPEPSRTERANALFCMVMLLLTMLVFLLRSCSAEFRKINEYLSWGADGSMTLTIVYWKQTSAAPSIRTPIRRTISPSKSSEESDEVHPRNRYLQLMRKVMRRGGLPELVPKSAPEAAGRSVPPASKKAKTSGNSETTSTRKLEAESEKEMSRQVNDIITTIGMPKKFTKFKKSLTSQGFRKTGCSAALAAGAAEQATTTWGLWSKQIPETYIDRTYMATRFSMQLFDFLTR
jgi:hypothetical protein